MTKEEEATIPSRATSVELSTTVPGMYTLRKHLGLYLSCQRCTTIHPSMSFSIERQPSFVAVCRTSPRTPGFPTAVYQQAVPTAVYQQASTYTITRHPVTSTSCARLFFLPQAPSRQLIAKSSSMVIRRLSMTLPEEEEVRHNGRPDSNHSLALPALKAKQVSTELFPWTIYC